MLSEFRSLVVMETLPPLNKRPPAAMNVARIPPPRSIADPAIAIARLTPACPVAAT